MKKEKRLSPILTGLAIGLFVGVVLDALTSTDKEKKTDNSNVKKTPSLESLKKQRAIASGKNDFKEVARLTTQINRILYPR